MPAGGYLTSDGSAELQRLGNHNACAFLEFSEPLSTFPCPDVALVAVLVLELRRLLFGNLQGLEIVSELDLLVESLAVGIVAMEVLGL